MMMTRSALLPIGTVLLVLVLAAPGWAQPVSVTYQHGLLSVDCSNAPIASVFESIQSMTGIELILEDEVKSKRLTASLSEVPLAMAIQRLLEGSGVNYIVMMDPRSWGQVSKVFVGAGGGGPARSAPAPAYEPPMDEPEPMPEMEEAYEEPMDMQEAPDLMETDPAMENQDFEPPPEDFSDPSGEFNPPGSSPIPDFLPPTPQYPRSSFTPGLPSSSQRSPGASQQQPQQQDANPPPPATFPFTDPFGRPIPIPPGMNEQQQQQKQGQPRRQQQQ
jgi:hypothetical protein